MNNAERSKIRLQGITKLKTCIKAEIMLGGVNHVKKFDNIQEAIEWRRKMRVQYARRSKNDSTDISDKG